MANRHLDTARRRAPRGCIIKRGVNSYTVKVGTGFDAQKGRYTQKWQTVEGSHDDAKRLLNKMLYDLDNGTLAKPGPGTLADFLDRWIKDYAKPNLSPRTVEGYEGIIRSHLASTLGLKKLSAIRPEHIAKYYADTVASGKVAGGALSARTVRHHHMLLHNALKTAVLWGLLARNPADSVAPPRAQHYEMATWDQDEMTRFLEAAATSPYYAAFYLALFSGLRRSELVALRWADVDLILGQIYVNRAMHSLKGGQVVFRQPKTAKARRTVALPPSAAILLENHRAHRAAELKPLGLTVNDADLVFCQPGGSPLLPNTLSHAWVKAVRAAGVKPIRFHDARHTHASLLLKQGVHPKIVQERLGHSSIAITLDTYSHVAPGLQQAAATRFDEAFAPKRVSSRISSNADYVKTASSQNG